MNHLLSVVMFAVAIGGGMPALGVESKPLNLLVIMTDEHNFRTLGCYRDLMPREQALMWGNAVVQTPNIDWIAQHGAICTSFYASTPVCSPSRAAFVSGRYPQNTPVVTNNIPLSDQIVTFAEVLLRRGYATGYAGKWHLDGAGKPQWSPRRKFGFQGNRFMFNRGHWKQLQDTPNGPRVAARKNGKPTYSVQGADAKNFTTDFLADRTVEFIRAHRDKPFCYMLSFPDPHGPDTVRPPYDTMFQHQTYEKPRTFDKPEADLPSWGQKQKGGYGMAKYYGMVKCIDDNVGKVLGVLRESELLDRTIVVFTADHGDLRGEHHRHNKGVPYEGSARIPFAIFGPGQINAGTVVQEVLTCVDFQPTILNLMGFESAGMEEGRDASTLFTSGTAPDGWTDIGFIRGTSGTGWLAAVTPRYKLIYSPRDRPWLLDLEKDPDELRNFYTDPSYRATTKKLARMLAGYAERHKDPYIANLPQIMADSE